MTCKHMTPLKVLKFEQRKPKGPDRPTESIWTCNCGGHHFRLIEGGVIRCWDCHTAADLRHFDPGAPL